MRANNIRLSFRYLSYVFISYLPSIIASRFVCLSAEDAEFGTTCMNYNEKEYPFRTPYNQRRYEFPYNVDTKHITGPPLFPIYQQVAEKTTAKECAIHCTANTQEVQAPGCCEFRLHDRTCQWAIANSIRKTLNKQNRATLCLKGKTCVKIIILPY